MYKHAVSPSVFNSSSKVVLYFITIDNNNFNNDCVEIIVRIIHTSNHLFKINQIIIIPIPPVTKNLFYLLLLR